MIGVPGIGTLPVPDMSIDINDRRHFIDVFAAFGSIHSQVFFWRKETKPITTGWQEDVSPDSPFVAEQPQAEEAWEQETGSDQTWVPEKVGGSPGWVQDQDNPIS